MSGLSGITATFLEPGQRPDAVLAQWRANRPAWLPSHYAEIDSSYQSVTWEMRRTEGMMKVVPGASFFGGKTVYRLTALFQSDGRVGTTITLNGKADEKTRDAITAAAASAVPGGVT